MKWKTLQGDKVASIVSAQWHRLSADLVHGNFRAPWAEYYFGYNIRGTRDKSDAIHT